MRQDWGLRRRVLRFGPALLTRTRLVIAFCMRALGGRAPPAGVFNVRARLLYE